MSTTPRKMARGRSAKLASAFSRWMPANLACPSVRTKIILRPARTAPALFVDVRGERYDKRWYYLKTAAISLFALVVVVVNVPPVLAWAEGASVPLNRVLLASILLFVIAQLGRVSRREYVWAHCRDLKRPVAALDVRRRHRAVARVRASRAAAWKPAGALIVSGERGFSSEAVVQASLLGIRCYRSVGRGFEAVN